MSVAFRTLIITVGGNRYLLRLLYLIWRAFPLRSRRWVTALFIKTVLFQMRLFRVDNQNEITPLRLLGSLSFWGVPQVDTDRYRLDVTGTVEREMSFSFAQILQLPSTERQIRMDCVGGFRNNSIMKGTPLGPLLDLAVPSRRPGE